MFKKLIVFITVIILLFVLHVPVLKLLTNPSKAQLAEYPLLTDGTNSENFEITRVYIGDIYDVVYAPDTKHLGLHDVPSRQSQVWGSEARLNSNR